MLLLEVPATVASLAVYFVDISRWVLADVLPTFLRGGERERGKNPALISDPTSWSTTAYPGPTVVFSRRILL